MLIVKPKHWYSWDFVVFDEDEKEVGEARIKSSYGKGTMDFGGRDYILSRESPRGAFLLESDRGIRARAEKPSAFRRTLTIDYEGRSFVLAARSSLRREMVLSENGRQIGAVAPRGHFPWRAQADLPEALPLELRMFVIGLTMMLWKRQAES